MQTIESIDKRLNPFDKIQKIQNKDDPNNRPSCKSLLKHQNRSVKYKQASFLVSKFMMGPWVGQTKQYKVAYSDM